MNYESIFNLILNRSILKDMWIIIWRFTHGHLEKSAIAFRVKAYINLKERSSQAFYWGLFFVPHDTKIMQSNLTLIRILA